MEKEEKDAQTKNAKAARSKKHTRLQRSFLRFSRALKKLHGRGHANDNGEPPSSSATSFLSGCMHPRTHSFASVRRHRHFAAASRKHEEDGDDALAINFQSLRVGTTPVIAGEDGSSTQNYNSDGGGEEGDGVPVPAADKAVVGGAGVAVVTFSAAPYEDFRRSMREMMDAARSEAEAGGSGAAPALAVDWDFMEELLFCYLQLNDRAVHQDILRAFTDTVAALRRRRRTAAKSRRTRRQRRLANEDGRDGAEAEAVASS
ncbi:uncharacterized protein LOC133901467 [Phragmites australis]|uniref:uncharacterized protein LOC133901467 n=1 Tax=Phragmites australis TaxID=29695 RepID=UPI002D767BDD|nr:uncharacterized protein LOC133901467 [Phragmites australis]